MSPTLSILVTAHNCADWLDETLNSLPPAMAGVASRCEIIIVNDASDDNTQAIIERFAAGRPRVRCSVTSLRNIGRVRNFAVSQAKGEYILMVDGDDALLPGAIRDHLAIIDAKRPDIYLSKLIEKRPQTRQPDWHFRPPARLTSSAAIGQFLVHRRFQAHFIGQYFRRTLLLSNPFPAFICYEDAWLFPLLLTKSQHILFSGAGFYLYRKHSTSLSTRLSDEKIACLLAATRHMDEVLPARFQPLITCHWIDVMNRYAARLHTLGEAEKVMQRIQEGQLLRFLLHPKIRLSYKRKMLQVRRKTRLPAVL